MNIKRSFEPITSIAPKLTTTTEIDVDSFKIGSFHELVSFRFEIISQETRQEGMSAVNSF
jgi:hypothetical protein